MNKFYNTTSNLVVFMFLGWVKGLRNYPATPPVEYPTEALLYITTMDWALVHERG